MVERIVTSATPLGRLWLDDPCAVLYELAWQRPGQNLLLELGGVNFIFVQDGPTATAILRDTAGQFRKYYGSYERLFGESRLTTEGSDWRYRRDLSQPSIRAANDDRVAAAAQSYFMAAVTNLLRAGDQNMQSFGIALDHAAAATLGETVLGIDISELGDDALDDMRLILKLASWENFPRRTASGVEHAVFVLDADDAKERLDVRFSELLRRHGSSEKGSLLSRLADANDIDRFGEMATLLFAGYDTTASALCWAMFLLGRDPVLQDRLRQSVAHIDIGKTLTSDDLAGLDQLKSFLIETLRIFPPIPMLSRLANEDMQLNGVRIRQGDRLLVSIIGIQQNSSVFHDPMSVRIDRHPEGQLRKDYLPYFAPFGDGQRICPGSRFANIEALTALVVILKSVKLSVPRQSKIRFRWDASMRQIGKMKLSVAPASTE